MLKENNVRLATTLALALCVALPAPIAASASAGVTSIHKHKIQMHQAVYGSFNPATTALAPLFAIAPAAPEAKSDVDKYDGLSRNVDDCNYGCIDNGP